MPINALPTPPSRSDTVNFAARGDAFLAALPAFQSEANALQVDVNSKQGAAAVSAASAAAEALAAATASAAALAGISYKGAWSGLTGALNIPASVSHNGFIWMLVANLANVTTATPGVSASWMLLQSIEDALTRYTAQLGSAAFADIGQLPQNVWPVIKSSAYTVTKDDLGKTLVVSGTTTITLPLAASVLNTGTPFAFTIKAITGAVVTVARSGSDTIETVAGNKSMTANTGLVFFPTTTAAWETL